MRTGIKTVLLHRSSIDGNLVCIVLRSYSTAVISLVREATRAVNRLLFSGLTWPVVWPDIVYLGLGIIARLTVWFIGLAWPGLDGLQAKSGQIYLQFLEPIKFSCSAIWSSFKTNKLSV
jgi:hypothetical protein